MKNQTTNKQAELSHPLDKTICLDFDGVIHSFITPWQGEDVIADDPVHGCREVLADFTARQYKIIIHSTRCHNETGRRAIASYMVKHELCFDEIAEHKPVAGFYVDDRGVNFSGNWQEVLDAIR